MFDFNHTNSYDGDNNNSDKGLFKGVRSSKFRHVYGSVARKDQCYDNINITKNAHDSSFCAVNPKFLAIVTESCGGGSFIVIPIDKIGRVDAHAGRVTGHKGQIYDIKWNPFNDNVIASCSDDCTIKLWYIPDEGLLSRNMNQPIIELRGHKRRVSFIEWHPTADNILVSVGFDHMLMIWNTATGDLVKVITCHLEAIHSVSFNRDGSLLATTSKDKKLRIIDPRSGKIFNEGLCHHGTKASKVVFLGDSQRLFTVGFSRYSDRQWAIWSQNDLSSPLTIENIDSSSGVLFPFFDYDTKMLYLAGKGDGNIRYYEVTDEPPYCHYLSQFLSGQPQRSVGLMPKRGCDVYKCEVMRFYKLHATKSMCEPISMIVPRKSEQFQTDIFPDTAAPTPALTADQWLGGQNRNPVLFNLKSGAGAKTHKPVFIRQAIANRANSNGVPIGHYNQKLEFISQVEPIDYRSKSQQFNNENEVDGDDKDGDKENEHLAENFCQKAITKQEGNSNVTKQSQIPYAKRNGMAKRSRSNHFEMARQNFQTELIPKSESALATNFRKSINQKNDNIEVARPRLPWLKNAEPIDESLKPRCDIVSVVNTQLLENVQQTINQTKNKNSATFVTINSSDESDDSANTTDDSITEELAFSSTMPNHHHHHSNNQNNTSFSNLSGNIEKNNSNDSVNSQFHSSDAASNSSPLSDGSLENNKKKEESFQDFIEMQMNENPKNEREVWQAFHDQRALIHNLNRQIESKNERIEELEKIIHLMNLNHHQQQQHHHRSAENF